MNGVYYIFLEHVIIIIIFNLSTFSIFSDWSKYLGGELPSSHCGSVKNLLSIIIGQNFFGHSIYPVYRVS